VVVTSIVLRTWLVCKSTVGDTIIFFILGPVSLHGLNSVLFPH
jgi:hypothetical protein